MSDIDHMTPREWQKMCRWAKKNAPKVSGI